jgi:uncharacterized protein
MMEPLEIIRKYYAEGTELYDILLTHSRLVTEKALEIAERNPQEEFDLRFVYEAAMLHDIGIYLTNAPKIHCHGSFHYICHGYLGADLMRAEGFPRHALVCERHTGTGISLDAILRMNLPVPHRDMRPVTKEEQLICYADKFFSKSHPERKKTVEQVRQMLSRFPDANLERWDSWVSLFS